jgi:hypothetical protein
MPEAFILTANITWRSHQTIVHNNTKLNLIRSTGSSNGGEGGEGGVGCSLAAAPNPQNQNLKNTDFVDMMISKVLRDLPFSWNQPLKSADHCQAYIWFFKNKLIKWKRKQGDRALRLSHGTCSHICTYINAVANTVMVQWYLWCDFYNVIFKLTHKFKNALGAPPPPPPVKTSECPLDSKWFIYWWSILQCCQCHKL